MKASIHYTGPSNSTEDNVKVSFFPILRFEKYDLFLQTLQNSTLGLRPAFNVRSEFESPAVNV
jgi:hypothetical protein